MITTIMTIEDCFSKIGSIILDVGSLALALDCINQAAYGNYETAVLEGVCVVYLQVSKNLSVRQRRFIQAYLENTDRIIGQTSEKTIQPNLCLATSYSLEAVIGDPVDYSGDKKKIN